MKGALQLMVLDSRPHGQARGRLVLAGFQATCNRVTLSVPSVGELQRSHSGPFGSAGVTSSGLADTGTRGRSASRPITGNGCVAKTMGSGR